MDKKTLADIGHEAWYLCNAPEGLPAIPLSSRAPEYQEAWRVAAKAIRQAVIDECIQAISGPLTIAAPPDVISAVQDLNELHIEALEELKGGSDD